jgi:hypothetical protein
MYDLINLRRYVLPQKILDSTGVQLSTTPCGRMESGGIFHEFLTSALNECEWLASRLCRFTPEERTPVPIMQECGSQSRSGRSG